MIGSECWLQVTATCATPALATQHVYLQLSVLDATVSLQDSYVETLTLAGLHLETGLTRSYSQERLQGWAPKKRPAVLQGQEEPPEKEKVAVCRRGEASGEASPAGAPTVGLSLHSCEKSGVYVLSHPVCGVRQWKPRMAEAGKSASHKSRLQCYLYTLLSTPSIMYKDTESDAGETRCNKTSSLLLGLRI